MPQAALLHCPIRGQLKVAERARDGMTFTEEKRRIDSIRFLLQRNYPAEHFGIETTLFRFGHKGRNSFRTDFSVYTEPYAEIRELPIEEKVERIKLVSEIKRDNVDSTEAKATQVRPAVNLLPDLSALGVYWDDIEQRFFYRTVQGQKSQMHEAPISKIPAWGDGVTSTTLAYADLSPTRGLSSLFDELENELHPHVSDKSKRYVVLSQLLLMKIHDENSHKHRPAEPLALQDFSAQPVADSIVLTRLNELLAAATDHYHTHLPEKIPTKLTVPVESLRRTTKLLAPINLLESKREVIQAFYMKFAKNLYKWDLAQYFTPNEVIDFIVNIANPVYGEHIKDPACGSADFLISAFRQAGKSGSVAQNVWGSDSSEQAAQVSVLNMLLNGDGKTNIVREDSLEAYSPSSQQFNIVLCNPPFGTRIVEKRYEVLRKFDLGREWALDSDGTPHITDTVLDKQQTGILFAELCVKLTKPKHGRCAVILPNGYLGNASLQYRSLREWLLLNARLSAVIGFPRFTFKKSGADVSASVVFFEPRRQPLKRVTDVEPYPIYFGMVDSVGWEAGDSKANPLYRRDPESGALLLDDRNEPLLDADFDEVFSELLRSPASHCFDWIIKERTIPDGSQGWHIPFEELTSDRRLILDPKRYCRKFRSLRETIAEQKHFKLGDVLEEVRTRGAKKDSSSTYRLVEIQNVGTGVYDYQECRGWELPDRAKLHAEPGDFFVASVWSSVGKWFVADKECQNVIVTNGCTRLRLLDKAKDYLVDVVAGLCSEAFRTQMRGLATGSDGLADVSWQDMSEIVLPKITKKADREAIQKYADVLLNAGSFAKGIEGVLGNIAAWPSTDARPYHWTLV